MNIGSASQNSPSVVPSNPPTAPLASVVNTVGQNLTNVGNTLAQPRTVSGSSVTSVFTDVSKTATDSDKQRIVTDILFGADREYVVFGTPNNDQSSSKDRPLAVVYPNTTSRI